MGWFFFCAVEYNANKFQTNIVDLYAIYVPYFVAMFGWLASQKSMKLDLNLK
jgi:hypothetical protein